MARYRSIHTKIDRDKDYQSLPWQGKYLFRYLLTNEATTESGLYEITLKTIQDHLSIPTQGVKKGLTSLSKGALVEYDYDNSIIWIVKFMKYQNQSPNVLKSINNDLQHYSKSLLSQKLYTLYQGAWKGLISPLKPLPSPPIGVGVGVGASVGASAEKEDKKGKGNNNRNLEPVFDGRVVKRI